MKSSFKDIYYNGTMYEWNATVEKSVEEYFEWDFGLDSYTIHFEDGDLPVNKG